jgi:transposase-like protein
VTADVFQVRLDEHHRRLSELERTQPAVLAAELRELRNDLAEVREEQRATKRALYTVALSVAAGAVTFAFTAFQIWGAA